MILFTSRGTWLSRQRMPRLTLVFMCFLVLTLTSSSSVFSDLLCKDLSVTPLQCAGTSAVHHLPWAPLSDYTIRLLCENHYFHWLINETEISLACSPVILVGPCVKFPVLRYMLCDLGHVLNTGLYLFQDHHTPLVLSNFHLNEWLIFLFLGLYFVSMC